MSRSVKKRHATDYDIGSSPDELASRVLAAAAASRALERGADRGDKPTVTSGVLGSGEIPGRPGLKRGAGSISTVISGAPKTWRQLEREVNDIQLAGPEHKRNTAYDYHPDIRNDPSYLDDFSEGF